VRTSHLNNKGYFIISLQRGTVRKKKRVHILVAEAFIGPNPGGMDVNHIDGVKTNNVASNPRIPDPLRKLQTRLPTWPLVHAVP